MTLCLFFYDYYMSLVSYYAQCSFGTFICARIKCIFVRLHGVYALVYVYSVPCTRPEQVHAYEEFWCGETMSSHSLAYHYPLLYLV